MFENQFDDNDLKPHWLPDDLLQRIDAAYALKFLGLRTSYDTLSQMASRRVGPPFIKRGRLTLYRYSDLVAWAEEEKKYLPARRLG
jgi:hypothetical protein